MITPAENLVIDNAVERIGEHFDTVQVMVSRYSGETGTTEYSYHGVGCWFARQGLARNFVKNEDARRISGAIMETRE